MLQLILKTIRIFVDNEWDDSPGWYEYLFNSARMLHLDPDQLQDIAVDIRNDGAAINAIRRFQYDTSGS